MSTNFIRQNFPVEATCRLDHEGGALDNWLNEGGHSLAPSGVKEEIRGEPLSPEEEAGRQAVEAMSNKLNADFAGGLVGTTHNTFQHRSRVLRQITAELHEMAAKRVFSRTDRPGLSEAGQAKSGHIVQTPTKDKAYKAVLEYDAGDVSEHPVDTMREGEDLIRSRCPTLAARNTLRDRPPSSDWSS